MEMISPTSGGWYPALGVKLCKAPCKPISWYAVMAIFLSSPQDSSPFSCALNSPLFIMNRFRIAGPHHCFLYPQGDETVTLNRSFSARPWQIMAECRQGCAFLADEWAFTQSKQSRMGPQRYPTLTSVARDRMVPTPCLDASPVGELTLSAVGASSFGQLSLSEGASFPGAATLSPALSPICSFQPLGPIEGLSRWWQWIY